jgi:hypothetical protein
VSSREFAYVCVSSRDCDSLGKSSVKIKIFLYKFKVGQNLYFDWTSEEEEGNEGETNNDIKEDENEASLSTSNLNSLEHTLSDLIRRLRDRPWFKQPKELTLETVFKSLIGSLIMRDPSNNDEISLLIRETIT